MRLCAAALPLLLTFLTATGCGGGGAQGGGGDLPLVFDLYVDAVAGSEANPGTAALPFKTLTAALVAASSGMSVHVAPGTYDAANGEAFPLLVPAGVSVVGDIAHRGDGPTPTLVSGFGAVAPGSMELAALIPADGTSLRGLKIQCGTAMVNHYGLWIASAAVELADCTLTDQVYAGAFLTGSGASDIHDTTFEGGSYALWISIPTEAVTVRDNAFSGGFYAIRLDAGPLCEITDNVFAGGSNQALQLFGTTALVQGNSFTHGAHSDSAVWVFGGAPALRSNTFTSNVGVRISSGGAPDLGTADDLGMNNFAGVAGFAVKHEEATVVQARGNTWQHVPPTAGVDIIVTGAGSVVYGPGAGDHVP